MKHYIPCIALAFLQFLGVTPAIAHGDDTHQITMLMKQQFERPDAPLGVAPIVLSDDYAVAGWLQAGRGGRALLQKVKGHWAIAVCGGVGLTQADVLQSTGMKSDAAARLSKAVQTAESTLGADKRKLFDSFEGMMKIDPSEGHSDHGAQAGHAQHGQHAGHTEAPKQ
jgi:periplasmic copper chaperone A